MNNVPFRKGMVFAIIILVIGVALGSGVSADNSSFVNTIYVDDDNTMGPWDGTQEHPYQHIRDGIDNASDGDTVFVYGGIYYEQINVNKSITLEGEDRNSTIIDGSGKKNVLITANWVNITGFQIISSGDHYHGAIEIRSSHNRISKNWITKSFKDAIEVEENASENIIVDNFIYENEEGIGIYICDAEKNIIKKNYFIDNRYEGLWLVRSSENLVTENVFTNNLIGVQVAVFSNNNTIENNLLESNQCGIELNYLCNHNKIKDNILNNFGTLNLFIKESSNNLVDNNTLSGTSEGITLHQSSHNIITNNTIQYIREFSLALALDSNNNMVALNTIVDNEMIGLVLHDASNNTIIENIITDNQEHGLYLERYSNDNLISKNHIANNNGYVIYFDNSSYNEITYNNLIFNKRNAYFQNSQNTWDKNYWNRPRFLPKLILGKIDSKLRIEVDWHPRFFMN